MSTPILYYFPASSPCRAVMMLAQIIGLALDQKLLNLPVGEQMSADFLKINPQHTVPTLDDNGFVLWESRAIMTYLVDSYAKNDSMYPKDLKTRALVDQRMQFDLSTLYQREKEYYLRLIYGPGKLDEAQLSKLLDALGFLEAMLVDRTWVAADSFTVADLTLTVTVSQIEGFGLDLAQFPRIMEWLERSKGLLDQYGYKEINQKGIDTLVKVVKFNLQQ